jgi:L-lysine exporter family protein LysE/ArgO
MTTEFISVLLQGFFLGLALIISFGPQNTFILRQGLRRQYVFMIALSASLIDSVLILLGTFGAGGFFARSPTLVHVISWTGVIFLFFYGLRSFLAALKPQKLATLALETQTSPSRQAVIYFSLGVSLLNPSVYLETMIIIGSSASRFADLARFFFAGGAILASAVWFFSLAFGAAKLSEMLRSPFMLRFIDTYSGVVMWAIAGRLVLHMV